MLVGYGRMCKVVLRVDVLSGKSASQTYTKKETIFRTCGILIFLSHEKLNFKAVTQTVSTKTQAETLLRVIRIKQW